MSANPEAHMGYYLPTITAETIDSMGQEITRQGLYDFQTSAFERLRERNPHLLTVVTKMLGITIHENESSRAMVASTALATVSEAFYRQAEHDDQPLPRVAGDTRFAVVGDFDELGPLPFLSACYDRVMQYNPKLFNALTTPLTARGLDDAHLNSMRMALFMSHELLRRQAEADVMAAQIDGRLVTMEQVHAMMDHEVNSALNEDLPELPKLGSPHGFASRRGFVLAA